MPKSRYLIGSLPWYSVLIVSGMLLAIVLGTTEEKRRALPKDTITDLALVLIPFSVLGARIYYVVFSWSYYRDNPGEIIAIWHGGLAILGGIIAGVITLLIFARKRHLAPLGLLDCIVPGVALAQSLGRWGNFFNSEAYGPLVRNPRLQFFPLCVQIPENGEVTWHLATFFLASMGDLLIFLLLWTGRKKRTRPGQQFALYLLLYGCGRSVLEELREDSLMSLGGTFRASQVLSLILVLLSLAFTTFPFLSHPVLPRRHALAGLVCLPVLLLPFTRLPWVPGTVQYLILNAGLIAFSVSSSPVVRRRIHAALFFTLLWSLFLWLSAASMPDAWQSLSTLVFSAVWALVFHCLLTIRRL